MSYVIKVNSHYFGGFKPHYYQPPVRMTLLTTDLKKATKYRTKLRATLRAAYLFRGQNWQVVKV